MKNLDKPDTLGFKKELEELIFPTAVSAIFLAALYVAGVITSYIPTEWIVAGVVWSVALMVVGLIGYGLISDLKKLLTQRGSFSFSFSVRCLLGWIRKTVTESVDSYPGSMP